MPTQFKVSIKIFPKCCWISTSSSNTNLISVVGVRLPGTPDNQIYTRARSCGFSTHQRRAFSLVMRSLHPTHIKAFTYKKCFRLYHSSSTNPTDPLITVSLYNFFLTTSSRGKFLLRTYKPTVTHRRTNRR